MRFLGRAAVGLAVLATAGCSSGLQPAVEKPFWFTTLSTRVSAGKIEPPTPSQTVEVPSTDYVLRVALAEYPSFQWQAGQAQDTSMVQNAAYEGRQACPTGVSGCVYGQAQQYLILRSGTTKIVFSLVAGGGSTKSPTPAPSVSIAKDAPNCPAGITAPPPSADEGCVLGRVTLTVVVP